MVLVPIFIPVFVFSVSKYLSAPNDSSARRLQQALQVSISKTASENQDAHSIKYMFSNAINILQLLLKLLSCACLLINDALFLAVDGSKTIGN